jgi:hypothetical protein
MIKELLARFAAVAKANLIGEAPSDYREDDPDINRVARMTSTNPPFVRGVRDYLEAMGVDCSDPEVLARRVPEFYDIEVRIDGTPAIRRKEDVTVVASAANKAKGPSGAGPS